MLINAYSSAVVVLTRIQILENMSKLVLEKMVFKLKDE